MQLRFQCLEIYSNVVDNPFCVFYLSSSTKPVYHILDKASDWRSFDFSAGGELAFVCQMFCERINDDGAKVTQFLGSSVVDVSTVNTKEYSFVVHDSSSHPALRMGQISIRFDVQNNAFEKMSIQNGSFSRRLYSAADSNLTWIHGFSKRGLPPIVHGLHYVHSPYYVNHMGVTLPAGSFCMIPTALEDNLTKAIRSHKQRFMISLCRNCMSTETWFDGITEMLNDRLSDIYHTW